MPAVRLFDVIIILLNNIGIYSVAMNIMCACACACARGRACARMYVRACASVRRAWVPRVCVWTLTVNLLCEWRVHHCGTIYRSQYEKPAH